MIVCMVRYKNLVDGKASTEDIRQTLGRSRWPAQMSINFNICLPVLMQELVMKVNKMERSYHRLALILCFHLSGPTWQVISYKRRFSAGCLLQIHGQITISLVKRITMALPNGLLKAMSSGNGSRLVVFYGSMAFVRKSSFLFLPSL